jgi:ubiquinone/menaquinone biosynthesis C-methylase UbiE
VGRGKPKVTVAIPSFNHESYIAEAIESVLLQDHEDFELLIVDDCSVDGTGEVIERYARSDSRIRTHFNDENLGMARNWNRCLELAGGEYFKLLNSDDILVSPRALRLQVEALDTHPTAVMTSCARYIIDQDSRFIDIWDTIPSPGLHDGREIIEMCLVRNANLVGEPSVVLLRRDAIGRPFFPGYRQIADMEMWLSLLREGDIVYIDTPLGAWRQHQFQTTQTNRAFNVGIHELNDLLVLYLDEQLLAKRRNIRSIFDRIEGARRDPEFRADGNSMARKTEKILGSLRYRLELAMYRLTLPLFLVKSTCRGLKGRLTMRMGSAIRLCVRGGRRLLGLVIDATGIITGRRDPLIPPQELVDLVGGGDFRAIGEEYFQELTGRGGLQAYHRVLEVGCGCGRMAIPLMRHISGKGRYYGFDVSKKCIAWCKRHIERKSTKFRFLHADIRNGLYNPAGTILPEHFVFPYADGFFDFVFLTSVFTHMRPEAMKHYLAEIERVLKPGGRCLSTFFLIDEHTREVLERGTAQFSFSHVMRDYYAERADIPEAALAYDESSVRACLEENHFRVIDVFCSGNWRNEGTPNSLQDMVCFMKPRE